MGWGVSCFALLYKKTNIILLNLDQAFHLKTLA